MGKQRPRPARSLTRTSTTSTNPGNYIGRPKRAEKWGSLTDPRGRENCRSGKPHWAKMGNYKTDGHEEQKISPKSKS